MVRINPDSQRPLFARLYPSPSLLSESVYQHDNILYMAQDSRAYAPAWLQAIQQRASFLRQRCFDYISLLGSSLPIYGSKAATPAIRFRLQVYPKKKRENYSTLIQHTRVSGVRCKVLTQQGWEQYF